MRGLLSTGNVSASEAIVAYPVEGGNIYFSKPYASILYCADIPAEIDGVAVKSIRNPAFSKAKENLKSVVFQDF